MVVTNNVKLVPIKMPKKKEGIKRFNETNCPYDLQTMRDFVGYSILCVHQSQGGKMRHALKAIPETVEIDSD